VSAQLDISDGICAYIVGGLGNQLFVLAAAWAQAERLGCPLYVDTSYYTLPGANWSAQIGDLDHPGIDVTEVSPWRGTSLIDQQQGLFGSVNIGSQTLYVFTEAGFAYDERINSVIPGTTIAGYFQSAKYFGAVREKLFGLLTSAVLSPGERRYVEAVTAEPRTSLHVRRGDYLSPRTNQVHGLAEPGYFARAMRLYNRLHPDARYRMYTDSPEVAAPDLQALGPVELAPPDGELRPIAGMLAMAAGEGIIISNSTYSWWAGWLINQRDPEATVIAPRPWFRAGESASDLLLAHWPTLDARD
jgi:hypothetical protein